MKIGFLGLLTLMLIGFKLANIITWPWWIVFSPLSLSIGILAAVVVAAYTVTR